MASEGPSRSRLAAALLLISGALACSGTHLKPGDFIGRYAGLWSADDRGTLVLSPDGSYSWKPDVESGSSRQRGGTFKLSQGSDGQWRITFKDSRAAALQDAPFLILFGRVRSITLNDDYGYFLLRK